MNGVRDISPPVTALARAWYHGTISEFQNASPDEIYATLAKNPQFHLLTTQKQAWIYQIDLLKYVLSGFNGHVFLEFKIPRMGRRIDAVVLIGPIVFVLEFKVGEDAFERTAIDQVWDYALDLKNFHETSHDVPIIPILVATEARTSESITLRFDTDQVCYPIRAIAADVRLTVETALKSRSDADINSFHWGIGSYRPTPTIIEAARALYANHSVEEIARSDAGAANLQVTSRRIEELVNESREKGRKLICFVTGVPGAGKTLVGLDVATRHRVKTEATHAVFLSGNAPLVAVLREALTRDELSRRKAAGDSVRKGKIGESVKAFIQNVHHFRDDALVDAKPPIEHVVIFDEAQRAWNLQQTAKFMRRKKNVHDFAQSEPEFLISCMDRHNDWAVVICLVGGGQEINTGEAGISAWLDAVKHKFSAWHVCISSQLKDSEYDATNSLIQLGALPNVSFDNGLHLAVSMRSFRAETVSTFVKAVLDCEVASAREAYGKFADRYPMAITRDLTLAKEWIRTKARGSERYGLVASSKAQRLKPHAIDIRAEVDPIHWFLNDREDTRSSYFLEDAATEFQVQGLELDWVCVTWDGDLRFGESAWSYHDFRGSQWTNVNKVENRTYLKNAYRVLLTRARQGMVIFVPSGDPSDHTRLPAYYDSTFNYLMGLGIPILS